MRDRLILMWSTRGTPRRQRRLMRPAVCRQVVRSGYTVLLLRHGYAAPSGLQSYMLQPCAGGGRRRRQRQRQRYRLHPVAAQSTGALTPSDPTQIDRLFRSGIPQTCPASTTCAVFGDPTARHYDAYTFTNNTGSTQCVTVDPTTACAGTNYHLRCRLSGQLRSEQHLHQLDRRLRIKSGSDAAASDLHV